MDVLGSLFGLLVLSPLFLITAIAIKLDSPVLVFRRPIGRGQQPFTIIKLRTMIQDAEARKSEVAHLNAHQDLGDARMLRFPTTRG